MNKYVCIDNSKIAYGNFHKKSEETLPLTKGRVYTDIRKLGPKYFHNTDIIIVIDDSGNENSYGISRFKLLDQVREEKLNKLFDLL